MYGCGGIGAGGRVLGFGGVGSTTGAVELTYADNVRRRTPFDAIGRPVRPSHHLQHRHHLQPQQQQQQQYENADVADNMQTVDEVNSTVNRLRCLQAELQNRDVIQILSNSKDKVCHQ